MQQVQINLNNYPNLIRAGIFINSSGELDIGKEKAISNGMDELSAQRKKKQLLDTLKTATEPEFRYLDQKLGVAFSIRDQQSAS